MFKTDIIYELLKQQFSRVNGVKRYVWYKKVDIVHAFQNSLSVSFMSHALFFIFISAFSLILIKNDYRAFLNI